MSGFHACIQSFGTQLLNDNCVSGAMLGTRQKYYYNEEFYAEERGFSWKGEEA